MKLILSRKIIKDNKRQYITSDINIHFLFNKYPFFKTTKKMPIIDKNIHKRNKRPKRPNAMICVPPYICLDNYIMTLKKCIYIFKKHNKCIHFFNIYLYFDI